VVEGHGETGAKQTVSPPALAPTRGPPVPPRSVRPAPYPTAVPIRESPHAAIDRPSARSLKSSRHATSPTQFPEDPVALTPDSGPTTTILPRLDNPTLTTQLEHAAAFLVRDFHQALAEKRRLEDQVWDTCKFAFAVHSGAIGLSVGLYQYSLDKQLELRAPAIALLSLALLVGLFLLFMMARVRVYFVAASRYINEQRALHLSLQPLGFVNSTGYYSDATQPKYFTWRSTQVWALCLVALLNAASGATVVFLLLAQWSYVTSAAMAGLVTTLAVQLTAVRRHLDRCESLTTSQAVWGKGRKT